MCTGHGQQIPREWVKDFRCSCSLVEGTGRTLSHKLLIWQKQWLETERYVELWLLPRLIAVHLLATTSKSNNGRTTDAVRYPRGLTRVRKCHTTNRLIQQKRTISVTDATATCELTTLRRLNHTELRCRLSFANGCACACENGQFRNWENTICRCSDGTSRLQDHFPVNSLFLVGQSCAVMAFALIIHTDWRAGTGFAIGDLYL